MNKIKYLILLAIITCIYGLSIMPYNQHSKKKIKDQSFILIRSSIANVTTHQYPIEIMTLKNQKLSEISEIASKQWNAKFLRVYNNKHLILFGGMQSSTLFEGKYAWVNNLNDIKSFKLSICADCSYLNAFIINKQNELIFLLKSGKGDAENFELNTKGYSLDDEKPTNVTLTDLKYLLTHGTPSGSTSNHDMLSGIYTQNNKATYGYFWNIDLGWRFSNIYKPAPRERISQVINNDHIRAFTSPRLYQTNGDAPFIELKVHNKQSNQWSSIKIAGQLPNIREFGPWIASEERLRVDNATATPPTPFLHQDKFLTAAARAYVGHYRQTGKLTLINPITQQSITFDTQSPDSEILLVKEQQLFYRIDNQLFTADIEQNQLLNTRLLIKDKRIVDVHWMMEKQEQISQPTSSSTEATLP